MSCTPPRPNACATCQAGEVGLWDGQCHARSEGLAMLNGGMVTDPALFAAPGDEVLVTSYADTGLTYVEVQVVDAHGIVAPMQGNVQQHDGPSASYHWSWCLNAPLLPGLFRVAAFFRQSANDDYIAFGSHVVEVDGTQGSGPVCALP